MEAHKKRQTLNVDHSPLHVIVYLVRVQQITAEHTESSV